MRPDLALDWYDTGLAAMGAGAAIFAPGIADRPEVIRKAAFTIGGRAYEPVVALPQFAADPAIVAPEVIAAPVPEAVQPAVPEKNVAALAAPAVEDTVAAPEVAVADPQATAPAANLVPTTGAQVVLMAARLPFLLFNN